MCFELVSEEMSAMNLAMHQKKEHYKQQRPAAAVEKLHQKLASYQSLGGNLDPPAPLHISAQCQDWRCLGKLGSPNVTDHVLLTFAARIVGHLCLSAAGSDSSAQPRHSSGRYERHALVGIW